MDICFDIYVTNSKKTNLERSGCIYESILSNSTELLVEWTSREFQNQTILFSRKIKGSM